MYNNFCDRNHQFNERVIMKKKYYLIYLIAIIITFGCNNNTDYKTPLNPSKTKDTNQTKNKIIRIATGLTVEPYVIKDDDKGFEIDIVREIFVYKGYTVKFSYQPLKRSKISFMQGLVDGVMTIKKNYPEIKNSYISNDYITYQNFAISLRSNNFNINKISDLSNKNIIGFQQAKIALGTEFFQMCTKNPNYTELANQKSQVSMLFLKRTEVVIMDYKIFKYYISRIKTIAVNEPVVFHKLFKASHYAMAFREKHTNLEFNEGLRKLKKSGRYDLIINQYNESLK